MEREKEKEGAGTDTATSGPAIKRRKAGDARKAEEEEEDLWTRLLAPLLTPAEFVHSCWEAQRPVHRSGGEAERREAQQKQQQPVCSSEQIFQLLKAGGEAQHPLYYRKDIRFTRDGDVPVGENEDENENEEEKDLIDEDATLDNTPLGLATYEETVQMLEREWSVRILNLDYRFGRVKSLLRSLDSFWKGEGGCSAALTLTPPQVIPFPPYSDTEDRIIFQLEGCQQVNVYRPFTEAESEEGETVPYFFYGASTVLIHQMDQLPEENVQLDAVLHPGDMLYVPKGFITLFQALEMESDSPSASSTYSLDLVLNLSSLPSWEDFLNETLQQAQQKLRLEPGARSFPHSLAPSLAVATPSASGSRYELLTQQASDVLRSALSQTKLVADTFQSRSKFHREDFDFSNWVRTQYDIETLLDENQGLVKISNFLPDVVASKLLELFSVISEEEWVITEAEQNYEANNINHAFMSSKQFPNHEAVFDMFRSLLPHLESTFSAGRYTFSHFIDPHDDKAYKTVLGKTYSRYIAFIYYLTPDWRPEYGGALRDLEGDSGNGVRYVPEFNSAVCFRVPRWHQVEKMLVDKPRYSVFGWFLKPGKLYSLDTQRPADQKLTLDVTVVADIEPNLVCVSRKDDSWRRVLDECWKAANKCKSIVHLKKEKKGCHWMTKERQLIPTGHQPQCFAQTYQEKNLVLDAVLYPGDMVYQTYDYSL
ncbi:uS12 prolyl 3-hydroxylase [Balamuthia mandrillaris]